MTGRDVVSTGSSPQPAPSVVARAVNLGYRVSDRVLLNDVNLELHRGKSVAVVGPSGSGKTTLLLCLAGLLRPDEGHVSLAGHDLAKKRRGSLAALRLSHVGFVYQFGELLPELTPLENVVLPALMSRQTRAAAFARAEQLLDELGVGGVAGNATAVLSGGERQRVAVARALITEPDVILADEPTGSLDQSAVDAVASMLFSLPSTWNCALLVVTHNRRVAERATRAFELTAGRLVEAQE